jgi:hypothetical protein
VFPSAARVTTGRVDFNRQQIFSYAAFLDSFRVPH